MTRPLRALIVDDEPLARRVLERLIAAHGDVHLAATVADGLEALAILANQPVDVLLADIALPRLAGLELVERLAPDRRPAVVFVTAHAEHAVRAFELGVADYLLKPVAPERLALALARVRAMLDAGGRAADVAPLVRAFGAALHSHTPDTLWVHQGSGRARVTLSDVELIRAEGDYVRVFTALGERLADGPLDRRRARLSPAAGFLGRREARVPINAVSAVRSDPSRRLVLTTASGHQVSTGRRTTAAVREALRSA